MLLSRYGLMGMETICVLYENILNYIDHTLSNNEINNLHKCLVEKLV